jgi:hypothetical protein
MSWAWGCFPSRSEERLATVSSDMSKGGRRWLGDGNDAHQSLEGPKDRPEWVGIGGITTCIQGLVVSGSSAIRRSRSGWVPQAPRGRLEAVSASSLLQGGGPPKDDTVAVPAS